MSTSTLRRVPTHACVRAIVCGLGLVAGAHWGAAMSTPATIQRVTTDRSVAWPGRTAAMLVRRHHCWGPDQPAPVDIPGHLVVTPPGARHPVWSSRLTDAALDQVFGGIESRLTVHAFCP